MTRRKQGVDPLVKTRGSSYEQKEAGNRPFSEEDRAMNRRNQATDLLLERIEL